MKTFLINAMILGFVTVGYAQGTSNKLNLEITTEKIREVPKNINYYNEVKEGTVSPRVLELQYSVANFNLFASTLFKGGGGNYHMKFRKTKGKIYVTFDSKGKIKYSMGTFKDVALPIPVRNIIYSSHPGWYVLENTYKSSYSIERGIEDVYKIKLGKGTLEKRLRMDAEGKLL
ncbi:hypothetical protein [Zobellia roscoffensis]|uniref:hypothetical protein n=1 Tax=Zobellia roscoffensis TaxID=2779508 RepID=UPI00188A7933|nr:hypothetical protein [Zobellia roscoffensis]